MTETQKYGWEGLIYQILANGNEKSFRSKRSAIRAGHSKHTEFRAYPHVLPYLDLDASPQQRTALLRCAALMAEFVDLGKLTTSKSTDRPYRVGRWAAWLKDNDISESNAGNIAARLEYLHTQDLEEAVITIRRILQFADSKGFYGKLDFFDLMQTFWFWGSGYSEPSTEHRLKVLRDFYGYQSTPSLPDSTLEGAQ